MNKITFLTIILAFICMVLILIIIKMQKKAHAREITIVHLEENKKLLTQKLEERTKNMQYEIKTFRLSRYIPQMVENTIGEVSLHHYKKSLLEQLTDNMDDIVEVNDIGNGLKIIDINIAVRRKPL